MVNIGKILELDVEMLEFIGDMMREHTNSMINASHPDIRGIIIMLKDKKDEQGQNENTSMRSQFDRAILGSTRARNGYTPLPKNPFNI